jgi:hypothetical protein
MALVAFCCLSQFLQQCIDPPNILFSSAILTPTMFILWHCSFLYNNHNSCHIIATIPIPVYGVSFTILPFNFISVRKGYMYEYTELVLRPP